MPEPDENTRSISSQDQNLQLDAALNALAKAQKALNFYPPDHPQRDEAITSAYALLKPMLQKRELILLWSRDACTAPEAGLRSTSSTAKALAREMLTRKLQRLIILPELSVRELKAFLTILTADASEVLSSGGIEKAVSRAGISSIGVNEVDLELLKQKQHEGAEEETGVPGEAGSEGEDGSSSGSAMQLTPEEKSLEPLLSRLKSSVDETEYLELAREIMDCVERLKAKEFFGPLPQALEILLQEYSSPERSPAEKEYTRYVLEQITDAGVTNYLLDNLEQRSDELSDLVDNLCTTIGKTLAYPLIQRLCVAESLRMRKFVANALTRAGEAAVPAIVSMLKDERWYVVRNMVTILGEIASISALKPLQQAIWHPETKVRKEVVKSLLKISPQGAESSVIELLGDSDPEVVRQAVYSLGAMRSHLAVKPLMAIVLASDTFLKNMHLKKLAIAALGRIGNRQATAVLMDILVTRGWLAPRRWAELKVAAATALGQMGDETALPLLKRLAGSGNTLGEACADAADNLERVVK
ncbi:MAG: HEAT repeat domain-containing protein [Geobacter sp.]|nr:HEAT repeat domain-containing protein [Geobacter sp.]